MTTVPWYSRTDLDAVLPGVVARLRAEEVGVIVTDRSDPRAVRFYTIDTTLGCLVALPSIIVSSKWNVRFARVDCDAVEMTAAVHKACHGVAHARRDCESTHWSTACMCDAQPCLCATHMPALRSVWELNKIFAACAQYTILPNTHDAHCASRKSTKSNTANNKKKSLRKVKLPEP